MEEVVAHLVETALGGRGWEVRRPEHGWSDRSYVAAREGRRVFVKLGTPAAILQRVAALGVAPAVLATGEVDGVPYAIQEFIAGSYPTHRWVVEHAPEVAAFLAITHRDKALSELLASAQRPVRQLRDMELCYWLVQPSFVDRPQLRDAYDWLTSRRPNIPETELVPTHGDVSPKNFLITPTRLVLIDWEDIALSDPMRDLGPFLWWYFRPEQWPLIMDYYGESLTGGLALRIHWWAACISLDVTAGLLDRGYMEEAEGFLGDFLAAASEQPNPRPQYRGLTR